MTIVLDVHVIEHVAPRVLVSFRSLPCRLPEMVSQQ